MDVRKNSLCYDWTDTGLKTILRRLDNSGEVLGWTDFAVGVL